MIRLLRVGRGPLASDLIYLCKYFQIFRYFISYSTKFASSCCCNTMFLYVLHFSTIYISLCFTFYVSLCFTFYDLCFSSIYVSLCFMFFLPLSASPCFPFLYPFLYISPSFIHFSMSLHPLPFITLSPSPSTLHHSVQLVLTCDK